MLTSLQRKGLNALARGFTPDEAAKQIGVQSKTIVRWLLVQEFAQELSQAEQEFQNEIAMGLRRLAPMAIQAIQDTLEQNKNFVAKLRAAALVLEHTKAAQTTTSAEMVEITFDPTGVRSELEAQMPDETGA